MARSEIADKAMLSAHPRNIYLSATFAWQRTDLSRSAMVTSSLSLPVELLHDIMVYLDRKSLASLAQSSRILNAVAVQHLHRTVPRMSGPDTIRCLNTFATTPDIAEKVRTFNIYSSFLQRTSITGPPPAHVQPPRKSVLNRLLAVFSPSSCPLPPVVPPSPHFIAGNERISLQNIADAFYNMKNLHTIIVHAPSHPRIWEFKHPIPTLRTVCPSQRRISLVVRVDYAPAVYHISTNEL